MVERIVRNDEAGGSIPPGSIFSARRSGPGAAAPLARYGSLHPAILFELVAFGSILMCLAHGRLLYSWQAIVKV